MPEGSNPTTPPLGTHESSSFDSFPWSIAGAISFPTLWVLIYLFIGIVFGFFLRVDLGVPGLLQQTWRGYRYEPMWKRVPMCLTVFIFYPVLITQKWIFYLYWKRQDVFHGEEPRPDGQQLDDRAAIELRERAGNGDRGEGSVQQEEQHHAQTEGESVRQE